MPEANVYTWELRPFFSVVGSSTHEKNRIDEGPEYVELSWANSQEKGPGNEVDGLTFELSNQLSD